MWLSNRLPGKWASGWYARRNSTVRTHHSQYTRTKKPCPTALQAIFDWKKWWHRGLLKSLPFDETKNTLRNYFEMKYYVWASKSCLSSTSNWTRYKRTEAACAHLNPPYLYPRPWQKFRHITKRKNSFRRKTMQACFLLSSEHFCPLHIHSAPALATGLRGPTAMSVSIGAIPAVSTWSTFYKIP